MIVPFDNEPKGVLLYTRGTMERERERPPANTRTRPPCKQHNGCVQCARADGLCVKAFYFLCAFFKGRIMYRVCRGGSGVLCNGEITGDCKLIFFEFLVLSEFR